MNNGEYKNNQSNSNKPASDILEAICAVIFLENGFPTVKSFINKIINNFLNENSLQEK